MKEIQEILFSLFCVSHHVYSLVHRREFPRSVLLPSLPSLEKAFCFGGNVQEASDTFCWPPLGSHRDQTPIEQTNVAF